MEASFEVGLHSVVKLQTEVPFLETPEFFLLKIRLQSNFDLAYMCLEEAWKLELEQATCVSRKLSPK